MLDETKVKKAIDCIMVESVLGDKMPDEKRIQLKKELNQILKNVAACDLSEINLQGEAIRTVFYTIMEANFTPEEIIEVFENVFISDEKMALIAESDQEYTR